MKHATLTIDTTAQRELEAYYEIYNNELTELLEDSGDLLQYLLGVQVELIITIEGQAHRLEFIPVDTLSDDDYIIVLEDFILGIEDELNEQDEQAQEENQKGMTDMDYNKLIKTYFTQIDGIFLEVKGVESNLCTHLFGNVDKETYADTMNEFNTIPLWGTLWRPTYTSHELLECAVKAGFDIYKIMLFDDNGDCLDGFEAIALNGGGYDFYSKHWAPLFNSYLGD